MIAGSTGHKMGEDVAMHWEHEVVRISLAEKERLRSVEWRSLGEVREVLDKWGSKVWELVSVIPSDT